MNDFSQNYLAFCAGLSLCLALAAATSSDPKLSHKVGNRDQIKTAASNLSAPAEPKPPEYIFRSVAQYFPFPRTFPCLLSLDISIFASVAAQILASDLQL